jgi:hypothetical protein
MKVKVEQFDGVVNQFIITGHDDSGIMTETFQSYQTVIAERRAGRVTLDPNWNYSRTTQKYLNRFLNSSKAEIEKRIESREYTVAPLN